MGNIRNRVGVMAILLAAIGCAKPTPKPATQVVVAITSDFTPAEDLSRIDIKVSKRDGSSALPIRSLSVVARRPKSNQYVLPVTFSIGRGEQDSFLLVVEGFTPAGVRLVEQRAIVTFQDHKTLLLQIVLGRACTGEFCDAAGKEVCYPVRIGLINAGTCGAVPKFDGANLMLFDFDRPLDFSTSSTDVEKLDAGGVDAAMPDDSAVDDSGTSGTGGTGGTDGGMVSDPCDVDHGGCDALVTCDWDGTTRSCGDCPWGYEDVNGDATACKDVGACSEALVVCPAQYPCQYLDAAAVDYTCRGQYADWTPSDSPDTFVVSADGDTVSDTRNGLEWQRIPNPLYYKYSDAEDYCAKLVLAGTGWRLPTKAELESLVDYGQYDPAIDQTMFLDTPSNAGFWTSSPRRDGADTVWSVESSSGGSDGIPKSSPNPLRCVRSTTASSPSTGTGGVPPGRYTSKNGTVLDTRTKLTWQQSVDGTTTRTQAEAIAYCASLPLNGAGWRLPKISELLTLVDPTVDSPAIDLAAFPGTLAEPFWSFSPYVIPPDSKVYAWYVEFGIGYSSPSEVTVAWRVRCVR